TWTVAHGQGALGSVSFQGIETLAGGGDDDTFALGDDFGALTVSGAMDDGIDTIDFTRNSGAIAHPNEATFTSSTGGTLTISGSAPERIDLVLADPEALAGGIGGALAALGALVEQLEASAPDLSAPLLLVGTDAARFVGLGVAFSTLAARASGASKAAATLSDVAASLNALSASLPNALSGLRFSTGYGGSNGDLLVYFHLKHSRADARHCRNEAGCVRGEAPLASDGV